MPFVFREVQHVPQLVFAMSQATLLRFVANTIGIAADRTARADRAAVAMLMLV